VVVATGVDIAEIERVERALERVAQAVAVQLVARFGDEATLFRLGAQLEAARPWFARKPALAT